MGKNGDIAGSILVVGTMGLVTYIRVNELEVTGLEVIALIILLAIGVFKLLFD